MVRGLIPQKCRIPTPKKNQLGIINPRMGYPLLGSAARIGLEVLRDELQQARPGSGAWGVRLLEPKMNDFASLLGNLGNRSWACVFRGYALWGGLRRQTENHFLAEVPYFDTNLQYENSFCQRTKTAP